jgi:methyltransferase (TIGR00027 family)
MQSDRPSSTAKLIARCTLLAAHKQEWQGLVPINAIAPLEQMLTAAGGGLWFGAALRHAWLRTLLFRGEQAVLPGIILHYLARKQWIEKAVIAALHAGAEQVVVLGAGFDTLAWRLHRDWPAVFFCELDHPATQRPKFAALAALGPRANFALQSADLATELPSTALERERRFDRRRRTCVVAEGLLMYFPEGRVTELLCDLAGLPSATVAFTFMEPGPDGRAAFRGRRTAINAWLHLQREPFAWAVHRADLVAFLSTAGLQIKSLAGADELRSLILAPAGLAGAALAEGESLCCATSPP